MPVERKRRDANLPYRRAFGARVRELREARGLAQDALSYEASVARRYLSAIEQGQANPTLDLIIALATTLGVEPGDLLPPGLVQR